MPGDSHLNVSESPSRGRRLSRAAGVAQANRKEGTTADEKTTPASLVVVLNWFEELKARVPTREEGSRGGVQGQVKSQRAGVRAEVIVQAQYGEIRDRGSGHERRRQVERVQRTNGLFCKGLPCAIDHARTNAEDRPVRGGRGQLGASAGDVGFGEFAKRRRADEDAVALDEREVGRDHQLGRREAVADVGAARFTEQPREDGA